MKKFILKQWYPSLPIGIEIGHIIEYDGKSVNSNGDEVELYLLRKGAKKEIWITSRELHPDFWELIEDEKPKPLFITEDGVDYYEFDFAVGFNIHNQFTINHNDWRERDLNNFKIFAKKSNADEYIWRNKRVFSYEDMMKAKHSIILTYEDIEKAAKKRIER